MNVFQNSKSERVGVTACDSKQAQAIAEGGRH
jgi:hypothetical protein